MAERTGSSASFLSPVENGRSDIDVVRHDEYVQLVSGGEGLDLLLLSRDGDRHMTPFVAEYTEGGGAVELAAGEGTARLLGVIARPGDA